jgi:adenylate cyclase
MPQLVATGTNPGERLELELEVGPSIRVGRKSPTGWSIPWDKQISREHADLSWNGSQVEVACMEAARNPIYVSGEGVRQASLQPGQSFIIGQTTFSVVGAEIVDDVSGDGPEEHAFDREALQSFEFRDAGQQIELLSKLPVILDEGPSDADFAAQLVELLLQGVARADAAAVVQYDVPDAGSLQTGPDEDDGAMLMEGAPVFPSEPAMMRVATADDYEGRFRPSRRLIMSTFTRRESIVHLWSDDGGDDDDGPQFTVSDDLDWAFCTPLLSPSCRGWFLYVSGIADGDVDEAELGGDLRFAELMAHFIGAVRQMRTLQETQTQLSSFFSPKVMESLTGENGHLALVPEERDISILFCDVQGFSRKSEQLKNDLHQLLTCMKEALSKMTGGILDADGTIADFQGDAALAFWGWPVKLEEGPVPACRAALMIQDEFLNPSDNADLLEGFKIGLGVSHGNAIAGQIGTPKQAKIGVFGPVVNQGARLESMTRQFKIGICIDEVTSDFCRRFLTPEEGRIRKLVRVRPKGMDIAITVHELMGPVGTPDTPSNEHIEVFETAVQAVVDGEWDKAKEILNCLEDEGPKEFLFLRMSELGDQPPADWDGAFRLAKK